MNFTLLTGSWYVYHEFHRNIDIPITLRYDESDVAHVLYYSAHCVKCQLLFCTFLIFCEETGVIFCRAWELDRRIVTKNEGKKSFYGKMRIWYRNMNFLYKVSMMDWIWV